jgi:hypothetical protein
VHGQHRIALVDLTCPLDTDAKRAKEHKASRYVDLMIALSNEGLDRSLYLTEVGARGHILKLDILKSVKDCLRSLSWAWVPTGHKSGIVQMIKDVSWISLVCLLAIFQACIDPSGFLLILLLDI